VSRGHVAAAQTLNRSFDSPAVLLQTSTHKQANVSPKNNTHLCKSRPNGLHFHIPFEVSIKIGIECTSSDVPRPYITSSSYLAGKAKTTRAAAF
jgi:hypothetical protein